VPVHIRIIKQQQEKDMKKARLIKKQEVIEREHAKKTNVPKKKVVKETMNAMVDWLGDQRSQRQDPRKAFAALFAQPQTQ
jgi:hypothetical protein